MVRSRPVDLIIADLQMPNVSGMELLQTLRASPNPRLRSLPVVLLTMQQDPEVMAAALAAGANAFLSKPTQPAKLAAAVRDALRG